FRRAYQARPAPRTRAQMALAEQALGRWIEAETDLAETLRTQGDTGVDKNRDKLAEGLEKIRGHLGWLDVEAREGAELWVNGTRIGPLPRESVRVVAASTEVEIRHSDFQPWARAIDTK